MTETDGAAPLLAEWGSPICPACWQARQKRVRMTTRSLSDIGLIYFECPECDLTMQDRRATPRTPPNIKP
ncbi:MAG TPA: hypothetical protein VFA98_08600 [Thermoanaerobaculia bacterium]|nr:hypothetical protein [Thermoanaerobaculia bacterium]